MAEIGKMNTLMVTKTVDFGVYLDGGMLGPILLPRQSMTGPCIPGREVEVFLYLDSEDLPIATMYPPKVKVGECACLRVVDVNRIGAFMDWGLKKDLLVPYGEQHKPMTVGQSYVVYIYIDPASGRITATSKIDKHLPAQSRYFKVQQHEDLLIYAQSKLGYKVIINNVVTGLLFHSEVLTSLKPGQRITGYIKKIRDDNKIDVTLQRTDRAALEELSVRILDFLIQSGGYTTLTDKSPPEQIAKQFGVSKSSYKKALGKLYKQRKIKIDNTQIELVKKQ